MDEKDDVLVGILRDLKGTFLLLRSLPATRSPVSQATNHKCAGDPMPGTVAWRQQSPKFQNRQRVKKKIGKHVDPGEAFARSFWPRSRSSEAFFARWLRERRNISVDRRVPANLRNVGRISSREGYFRAIGLCSSILSHLPQKAWAGETLPGPISSQKHEDNRGAVSDSYHGAIKTSSCGSSKQSSRNTCAAAPTRPKHPCSFRVTVPSPEQ